MNLMTDQVHIRFLYGIYKVHDGIRQVVINL